MPATRPTAPSAVIQASEAQANQRAYRVYRSQRSSRLAPGLAQLSQHVQASGCVLSDAASGIGVTKAVP